MIRLIVVIILSSFFVSANTEVILDKNFTSSFSQLRFIKASELTLKSSGEMKLVNGKELYWNQEKPFVNKMIITEEKIYSVYDNKKKEVKNPATLQISQMVFQMIKGDRSIISKEFAVLKKEKGLNVVLRPKDEVLKKFINKIVLKGSKYVEFFKLVEKSGNYIEIKFSQYRVNKNK